MKYLLLIGLLWTVISCGEKQKESAIAETETTQDVIKEVKLSEPEPLPEPCQISGVDLSEILGEKFSDGLSNGINSETRKACDYGSKKGNFSVGFQRFKERTIERKYLEKAFETDLAKTSGSITYEEVSDGFGDQTIFFYGKKGPVNVFTLRWRFGNHTEKLVTYSSSSKHNAKEKLEQLKAIARKIEG